MVHDNKRVSLPGGSLRDDRWRSRANHKGACGPFARLNRPWDKRGVGSVQKPPNRRMTSQDRWRKEARRACDDCEVRHMGICSALGKEELDGLNRIARMRTLKSGQRIISDQEHAENFAIVVSGTIKLSKALPDGRQQIVGLLFPSDFVGRPFQRYGSCQAEAATDVQICSFPAASFESLMQLHPGLENRVFRHALDELDAAQDWMLLLGRKTARERVATLLLMIARRAAASGGGCSRDKGHIRFDLPLGRADVADFLGLRLETVSRQIRALASADVIQLKGTRAVTVLDLAKLEAVASGGE